MYSKCWRNLIIVSHWMIFRGDGRFLEAQKKLRKWWKFEMGNWKS